MKLLIALIIPNLKYFNSHKGEKCYQMYVTSLIAINKKCHILQNFCQDGPLSKSMMSMMKYNQINHAFHYNQILHDLQENNYNRNNGNYSNKCNNYINI